MEFPMTKNSFKKCWYVATCFNNFIKIIADIKKSFNKN